MILPIYLYGHSVLRKNGYLIKERTDEIETLIENMFETLDRSEGVGLSAHQVGKPLKLFIIDYMSSSDNDYFREIFINPKIISHSDDEQYMEEGCLSLPEISGEVKRPTKIKIKYLNGNFEEVEKEYDGFISRIIQHEYDHTNGKLYIDRLHPLKKKLLSTKLQKILKRKINVSYKIK